MIVDRSKYHCTRCGDLALPALGATCYAMPNGELICERCYQGYPPVNDQPIPLCGRCGRPAAIGVTAL